MSGIMDGITPEQLLAISSSAISGDNNTLMRQMSSILPTLLSGIGGNSTAVAAQGTPVTHDVEEVKTVPEDADGKTVTATYVSMDDRYKIAEEGMSIAMQTAEDLTLPLSNLRAQLKRLGFHDAELQGRRKQLVRMWLMANGPLLPAIPTLTIASFNEDAFSEDPVFNQFVCPVHRGLSTRWWLTDGGEALSDEAVTGILNAERDRGVIILRDTIKHPVSRKPIKRLTFNNEKQLLLRGWAAKNHPDLLEPANGGVPLLEGTCTIKMESVRNRITSLFQHLTATGTNTTVNMSIPVSTVSSTMASGAGGGAGGGGDGGDDSKEEDATGRIDMSEDGVPVPASPPPTPSAAPVIPLPDTSVDEDNFHSVQLGTELIPDDEVLD